MDMKSEGQGEVQGDCVVVFGNMVINTQKEGSELRSYSLKGMGEWETVKYAGSVAHQSGSVQFIW